MRCVGHVDPPSTYPEGLVSGGSAWIRLTVSVDGHEEQIAFLIDTGASATSLQPFDAMALFGDEFEEAVSSPSTRRVVGRGVSGLTSLLVADAKLTFRSTAEERLVLEQPILLADPVLAAPVSRGERQLPSLLGRDVLRHFRIELDYGESPFVVLETL